jgi:predicted  nucleic acid-binding Zn-ribbon protein
MTDHEAIGQALHSAAESIRVLNDAIVGMLKRIEDLETSIEYLNQRLHDVEFPSQD